MIKFNSNVERTDFLYTTFTDFARDYVRHNHPKISDNAVKNRVSRICGIIWRNKLGFTQTNDVNMTYVISNVKLCDMARIRNCGRQTADDIIHICHDYWIKNAEKETAPSESKHDIPVPASESVSLNVNDIAMIKDSVKARMKFLQRMLDNGALIKSNVSGETMPRQELTNLIDECRSVMVKLDLLTFKISVDTSGYMPEKKEGDEDGR